MREMERSKSDGSKEGDGDGGEATQSALDEMAAKVTWHSPLATAPHDMTTLSVR